jgi:dihydroxyacetone kinase-like protein
MSENPGRQLGEMFQMVALAIDNEKDHLSKLDGAIGDGDHGITMSLGFRAVNSEIAKLNTDAMTPSEIMAAAAAAFLNAVGASTGPLYATGFRRASKSLEGTEALDQSGQATMIQAIAEGIAERGKGQRGDKTMLDAWLPAAEAARNANAANAAASVFWKNVVAAADAGAASTRSMVATKGRAARVGERSLGHMDPGAASAVIIISEMARAFQGQR